MYNTLAHHVLKQSFGEKNISKNITVVKRQQIFLCAVLLLEDFFVEAEPNTSVLVLHTNKFFSLLPYVVFKTKLFSKISRYLSSYIIFIWMKGRDVKCQQVEKHMSIFFQKCLYTYINMITWLHRRTCLDIFAAKVVASKKVC